MKPILLPEQLFNRKLILISGKGGVGKSFLARELAVKASQKGRRVLLVELADHSAHQELLQIDSVKHKIQSSPLGIDHINITYGLNFRDYVIKYLGLEKIFKQVFDKKIIKSFLNTVPGLNEITFLGRLYFECEVNDKDPYDLVVFDAFSSGHFLKLMSTPQGILGSGLVGPVLKETQKVHQFLSNREKVATLFIGRPEKLIAEELIDFVGRFQKQTPIEIDAIVLNGSLRSSEEELDALPELNGLKDHLKKRASIQKKWIQEVTDKIPGKPLILTHEVKGVAAQSKWESQWNDLGWFKT